MDVSFPTENIASAAARLRQRVLTTCLVTSDREFIADRQGNKQDWLIDLRVALTNGECLALIADCFWSCMGHLWPFQLAAQEMAAVPLLGALLLRGAGLGFAATGVIVRSERKTHGRQRMIEGELTDAPILLIDDLFRSGASLRRAAAILAASGGKLRGAFVVIDFETESGHRALGELDLPLERMLSLEELGLQPRLPPESVERRQTSLAVLWRFEPAERRYAHVARKSAPVLAGDRLLHATEDGHIHALDPASGARLWSVVAARRARKGVWSTPCVNGGMAYVGSYDGAVLGLDMASGRVRWRFEGADWVGSSPCMAADCASLFIGLEHAIGGGTGSIVCLGADDGEPLWEHPVPALVHGSPALLGSGRVLCGANDGILRCLDAADGRLAWESDVHGAVKGGVAVTADGRHCFAGTCGGRVVAFDRLGRVIWRFDAGAAIFHRPLLVDGSVAVATLGGVVFLLDAQDGSLVARRQLAGKLFAAPVQAGASLLVGSTTGCLTRLARADLTILAEHVFPERIVSEVAVAADRVFVATFDGELRAVAAD